MAATNFPLNHSLAVQRWSNSLAVEAENLQYFKKFMGTGFDSMLRVIKDLSKTSKGEKITFGLRMKLTGDGVEDDNTIEGTSAETALDFYNDSVYIGQRRKGTKSKGKMSEQRVPYNMREQGRDALAIWFAEDVDQQWFMYLSGARGIDTSFHFAPNWAGRAGNTLTAPSTGRQVYGGTASGKGDLTSSDILDIGLIERLVAKAETTDPMIQPFRVKGEKKHVLLMHTFDAYNLRNATSDNDWVDISKNTDGQDSKLYKNSLGEYAGAILHKHRNVIRFSDYGNGGSLYASRCLFLGAQAGVVAYGANSSFGRYSWNEETDDRGNALAITAGAIYGLKKTTYTSEDEGTTVDFGVFAADCYCADPNA